MTESNPWRTLVAAYKDVPDTDALLAEYGAAVRKYWGEEKPQYFAVPWPHDPIYYRLDLNASANEDALCFTGTDGDGNWHRVSVPWTYLEDRDTWHREQEAAKAKRATDAAERWRRDRERDRERRRRAYEELRQEFDGGGGGVTMVMTEGPD